MATCNVCSGQCFLPSGRYHDCYSCGGRGYGSSTDQACSACAGSGKSSSEITEPCWQCNATGVVVDPPSYATPARSGNKTDKTGSGSTTSGVTSSKSKKTNKKEDISDTVCGLSFLIAAIVGFVVYSEKNDIVESLISSVITFFAAAALLYVGYYILKAVIAVLKVLLVIAFWFAVAVFVGNFLEFEWAVEIVSNIPK
ncbi:hypothetical protein [Neptunomonas qingdaonensis]|uniref:Uncharacterized protein n=1 Tax=Neptunomonas qingdaonensis TaxID=1045558 RepID=A0A1I2SH70_9GAMM|nr:hypothetical protein [Neptunomonas qingdaonensis]SFG52124.1 hypothetical protein SAMN05216175_10811 [Neptunomonas qingdaonensis]